MLAGVSSVSVGEGEEDEGLHLVLVREEPLRRQHARLCSPISPREHRSADHFVPLLGSLDRRAPHPPIHSRRVVVCFPLLRCAGNECDWGLQWSRRDPMTPARVTTSLPDVRDVQPSWASGCGAGLDMWRARAGSEKWRVHSSTISRRRSGFRS